MFAPGPSAASFSTCLFIRKMVFSALLDTILSAPFSIPVPDELHDHDDQGNGNQDLKKEKKDFLNRELVIIH